MGKFLIIIYVPRALSREGFASFPSGASPGGAWGKASQIWLVSGKSNIRGGPKLAQQQHLYPDWAVAQGRKLSQNWREGRQRDANSTIIFPKKRHEYIRFKISGVSNKLLHKS